MRKTRPLRSWIRHGAQRPRSPRSCWEEAIREPLRCSFCHKSQDAVQKLISSPSDDVRAFICDECVSVCQSILDDDRRTKESVNSAPQRDEHAGLDDRFVSQLVDAVEQGITKESLEDDASRELEESGASQFTWFPVRIAPERLLPYSHAGIRRNGRSMSDVTALTARLLDGSPD